MKISMLPAIVFIVFVASSCSTLLNATFESDAIDNPPATDLPGPPAGDEIQFNAAMSPQLKVQNSDISGNKALFYSNAVVDNPPPVASRWIGFKAKATDLNQTIWFNHTGENMGSSILIDVSDGHGALMARMRIKPDGEVGLSTSLTDVYSDVIGHLASGPHTMVFTVFPSTLKYNVTILQSGAPTITASNKPMITEDVSSFANPAHPRLSFLQEGSGSLTYAIGSVTISRREP
jgi:hypothetical protein